MIYAPDGSPTTVAAEGSLDVCPPMRGTWTLVVSGPGGEDTASATV
jgi:hypothetical protein